MKTPRLVTAFLLSTLALFTQAARAQSNLPVLTVHDAEVFEGDSGTTDLVFSITLDRASNVTVSGDIVFGSIAGFGTSVAIGGAANGGSSVDFIQVSSTPFAIRAGATAMPFTVAVRGDTTVEPDELLSIVVKNLSGARAIGTNTGIGTIRNDDGPPRISIADVSASEPFGKLQTRNVNFAVTLSHPLKGQGTISGTSVNFITVAGTAGIGSGSITNPVPPDFGGVLGTLTIPQGTLTGQITVPIFGDDLVEPDETFQVVLSSPVNGTIEDGSATGTIRDFQLVTGAFDFAPDKARVAVDKPQLFTVIWTVPEGETWRDLRTIDLRLRDGHGTTLYLRWDEATNTFSLGDVRGKLHDQRRKWRHHDEDDCRDDVTFGPGKLPGSNSVLAIKWASLDLSPTTVTGSGADGRTVTLELGLTFTRKSAGHAYRVDLAASDDLGHEDGLTKAGTVQVQCRERH